MLGSDYICRVGVQKTIAWCLVSVSYSLLLGHSIFPHHHHLPDLPTSSHTNSPHHHHPADKTDHHHQPIENNESPCNNWSHFFSQIMIAGDGIVIPPENVYSRSQSHLVATIPDLPHFVYNSAAAESDYLPPGNSFYYTSPPYLVAGLRAPPDMQI
jgi:hypothetical protein